MTYKIAIFDVMTLIGQEIMTVLSESDILISELYPLTVTKTKGRDVSFGDQDIKTIDVDGFDFSNCDVFFHSGHGQNAQNIIHQAIKAGCKVVDIGGHHLFDDIHGQACASLNSAVSAQLLSALAPLHAVTPIRRVVVSTYEATSSLGKDGMDELFNQSRKFFVHDEMETHVFGKQIAFNVIPQTDMFMEDGMTKSEWRIGAEVKKALGKDIKVAATCVQVPVFIGHGISVNVEFESDIDVKTVRGLWREAEGITIIDTASEMEFVSPAEIAGEDAVFISRIREDNSVGHGLSFWCAADNIRGSIALKAVEMARGLIR